MVMEASPSPQSVGREFVRQYYTLLNKAPAHLHRFYNNFSSFVHGGLDAPNRETLPVVGQKQIHNRIQQLNFRDCHAKISQVDSQATLGNGVVVQVTGELSNGGAPMRRFTQTFVLAAQSPKKYYVHNDIFRYQDIVFSDEEGSGSARSEGEEDEPRGYFPPPPYPPAAAAFPAPPPPPAPLDPPAPLHLNGHPPAAAPQPPPDDSARHLVAALHAATSVEREPEAAPASPAPRAASPPPPAAPLPALPAAPEDPEPQPEPPREPSPRPATPQPAAPPSPPAPKTYANLLKSGGAPHVPAPPAAAAHPPAPQVLVHRHHAPQQVSSAPAVQASSPPAAPAPHEPRPRPQRPPRDPRDLPPPPAEGTGGAGSGAGTGSTRRYSDAQQLFLGNLPHAATEDALRSLFSRFGPIAELRVHSKPAAPGAPRHPNYGFITYESPQAALDCLTAAPLYFEDVKLNVEEKKARGREPPRRRPPSAHRPPFPRAPYRR